MAEDGDRPGAEHELLADVRTQLEPAGGQHAQRVAVADEADVVAALHDGRDPGQHPPLPGRPAARASRRGRRRPTPTSRDASRGPARSCGPPPGRSPTRRGRARPPRSARRARPCARRAAAARSAPGRTDAAGARPAPGRRPRRRAAAGCRCEPVCRPSRDHSRLTVPDEHHLSCPRCHGRHPATREGRSPVRGPASGTCGAGARPRASRRSCPWSPRRSRRSRRCRRGASGPRPGRSSAWRRCRWPA